MVSKTTFKIKLKDLVDVSKLDTSQKSIIKKEIGEFIIDKILLDVAKAKSPVTGEGWDSLSKEYRKEKVKKGSSGRANLELSGDMLDALKMKEYNRGIEVGIFDYDQAQKSDNHNKFSAKSRRTGVPERQFIPRKGQMLKEKIMKDTVKLAKNLVKDAIKDDE